MTILIVDDHEENLYLLRSLLKGNGYEVISAENGAEALEKLGAGGIDMVISDILMPVMDGFQLCRNIKTDNEMRDIPFIVYTATYTDSQDEILAMKMGADRFIVKPSEPGEFMKAVNEVFTNAHSTKKVFYERHNSDEDVSRMYSERLVKKLEEKVVEAEREIQKRLEAEKALKALLEEKTQLIREIYHRTKNNMQVIISMLTLYARKYDDGPVQSLVRNIVNRIQAMAMVHEKLIKSQNLSSIDLDEYFLDFSKLLKENHDSLSAKVKLSFDLEPVKTVIDIAVPCGLVLEELISNALEHAFPNEREGEIRIGLRWTEEEGIVSMSVSDNGIGFPTGFDYRSSDTIGFPTIIALVEQQLQGSIDFNGESGLSCIIQFRDNQYRKRV